MAAHTTANGLDVSSLKLSLYRTGPWEADIEVMDSDAELTETIELNIGGQTFVGTADAARTGSDLGGLTSLTVRGGAGGLDETVERQGYTATTVAIVLGDLLAIAGESLSSTVDASLLSVSLLRWTRQAGTVREAIRLLMEHLGHRWRILADGSFWFGSDDLADSGLTEGDDYTVTDESPKTARDEVAIEEPSIRPGQTFRSKAVEAVHYRLDGELRATVEYDSPNRLERRLEGIAKRATGRMAYAKPFEAKVVKQNADGSLELRSLDESQPNLSRVPYMSGAPGLTLTVTVGAVVKLEFLNGDPTRPVVTGYGSDGLTSISVNGGMRNVARVDDAVNVGTLTITGGGGAPVGGTYIAPDGTTKTIAPGVPFGLSGVITSGANSLKA